MDSDNGESDDNLGINDLLSELEELEEIVDSREERKRVGETIRVAERIPDEGLFGRTISKYTSRDKAEAFIGSFLFGLPLLVEDGVLIIGKFMSNHPALFLINLLISFSIVISLLYVADFQDVEIIDPFFGFIPRRVVGIIIISGFTASGMMTLWGRVTWNEPWIDICSISIVFTAMAIGASLGDILPGQSEDIDFPDFIE